MSDSHIQALKVLRDYCLSNRVNTPKSKNRHDKLLLSMVKTGTKKTRDIRLLLTRVYIAVNYHDLDRYRSNSDGLN